MANKKKRSGYLIGYLMQVEVSQAPLDETPIEPTLCRGCSKPLVLCPHCFGEDHIEGGRGQGGFDICTDPECSEYEVCCGC